MCGMWVPGRSRHPRCLQHLPQVFEGDIRQDLLVGRTNASCVEGRSSQDTSHVVGDLTIRHYEDGCGGMGVVDCTTKTSTRTRGGLAISYLRVILTFVPACTNHIEVYGSRYYLIAVEPRENTKENI